jgi:hypothetical protein
MPVTADEPLRAAIARVATVFAGMASPEERGCGNCYSPADIAALRTPAVDLPEDLAQAVAVEVPDHWDDHPAVIRRVLPPIVGLMAEGSTWPERIVCQWVAAGWTTWPAPQVQALTSFLEAWLTWTLRQESPPTPAREVFEACATATSSVTAWIAHWGAAADPTVTDPHLAEAAQYWELEWGGKPLRYWSGTEAEEQAAYTELKAWLTTRNLLNSPD